MPHVVTGIADAITTLALNHERRRDALRPALSLRSVGNGLKLRHEFRALRRAPWRRVPTGAPAPVGTGSRLLFVGALRSKAFFGSAGDQALVLGNQEMGPINSSAEGRAGYRPAPSTHGYLV